MREDRGSWMQTYKGIDFYPFDPKPEDIDIEDIAHAQRTKALGLLHKQIRKDSAMLKPPSKLQRECLLQIRPEGSSTTEIANRLNRAHHECLASLRGLVKRKMVRRGTVTLMWFVASSPPESACQNQEQYGSQRQGQGQRQGQSQGQSPSHRQGHQ